METTNTETTTKPNAAMWGRSVQEAETAIELALPSGFTVKVRRVPLTTWLMSGRLPEKFLGEAMDAAKSDGDDSVPFADQAAEKEKLANLEGKELMQMLSFIRDVVTATVVHPRIVVGASPDSPDEIDPARIPEEDFYFIFAFAMQSAPGIPVKNRNGNMTVGAVAGFHPNKKLRSNRRRV